MSLILTNLAEQVSSVLLPPGLSYSAGFILHKYQDLSSGKLRGASSYQPDFIVGKLS